MTGIKIQQSLNNLGNALARLEEALQVENPNALLVDGTIQRFEFCIELFWKTLKRCLEHEGIHAATPRESLEEAFRTGWLKDEVPWLQMLRDRNATSHVYNEQTAQEIYKRLQGHYQEMNSVYNLLRERYI